ncbi:MAG: hypothetical protein H0X24_14595 [Ktedonobacterales bacterium]|nr:hypothetical protein [Ktedonobacterales bacterium]
MAQKTPPEVAKYALLATVWGFIAILAFIFLPWVVDNAQKSFTGFAYIQEVGSKGLGAIQGNAASSLSDPTALGFLLLILFTPLAAILAIGLSIAVNVGTPTRRLIVGEMVAAALGVVGTLVMFIPNVAQNSDNQRNFAIAGLIVILSTVISQLQRQLRQFFQSQPTLASIVLIGLIYLSVVLANYASFAQIVVKQSGIWLALVAFLLMFYGGTKMIREARKARRGK